MKKLIKKGLIILALSAQIAPAFGQPGAQPSPAAPLTEAVFYPQIQPHIESLDHLVMFPNLAQFLDPGSVKNLACTSKTMGNLVSDSREPREMLRVRGEKIRLKDTTIRPLNTFELIKNQKVTEEFAKLGPMYEVAGLIWSGVEPRTMNHEDAVAYCAGLGGGARLPTKDEYIALSRAMGSRQPDYYAPRMDADGYNRNLIPDMNRRTFWSASVLPQYGVFNFYFGGDDGYVNYYDRADSKSVRCVR